MPEPVGCPSCGHMIDDADGVCAVCGFTVRRSAATPVDAAVDAAADVAVDGSAGSTAEGGGRPAGRRRRPAGRPASALPLRSARRLRRSPSMGSDYAGRAAFRDGPCGRPPRLPRRWPSPAARASRRGARRLLPRACRRVVPRPRPRKGRRALAGRGRARGGQGPRASARALSRTAGRVTVPAGFDQVLGSDFRVDSAISGAGPRDAPPAVTRHHPRRPAGPRRAPRPSPSPRGGAAARRSRPRRRPARRRRAAARPCRGSAS